MTVLTFSNSQSSHSVKLHHSSLLQHLIHTKPPQQQLQRAAVFNEGPRAPPSLSPESIIVFLSTKVKIWLLFRLLLLLLLLKHPSITTTNC
jgi:hypothetical protein